MRHNEIQLMVYGADLHGVVAKTTSPHLQIQDVEPSASGKYCFVDVVIKADHLNDGTRHQAEIVLECQSGRTRFSFAIHPRESAAMHGGQKGFGPSDVVYLITPDRFANGDPANDRAFVDEFNRDDPAKRHGGDLQGVIDRLDYLADLGVTVIWLNPVLENRGVNSYHGYKTTNFYRIDPRLGSNDDYRRLVKEAHRRGLKIIFDHVTNHVGLQHPWVQDRPQPDWFNGSANAHLSHKHFLYAPTDPYGAQETREELERFWFVDRMPDLDQRNQRLSAYLIQNAIWWVEYSKLDGIREDTYPYADQSHMQRFVDALEKEFPHFNVVGEIWALEPAYIAQYQKNSPLAKRHGADETVGHLRSVMDFPTMDVYRRYIQGDAALKDIYERYATDFVYGDPQQLVTFIENHDTTRAYFIAERETARLKIAMQLLLTTRGIPQLLYGCEINMYGGRRHVDLRADFPGGFPGDGRDAFNSDGRTESENEAFNYLRQLLQLRRKHKALSIGTLRHYPPTENIYVYTKTHDNELVVGVINGNADPRVVDLGDLSPQIPSSGRLIDLRSGVEQATAENVKLQPFEPRLFRVVP